MRLSTATADQHDASIGGDAAGPSEERDRGAVASDTFDSPRTTPGDRLSHRVVLGAAVWIVAAAVPVAGPWSVLGLCRIAWGQGVMAGISALTSIGGPSFLAALLVVLWWIQLSGREGSEETGSSQPPTGLVSQSATTLRTAIRGLTTVFHAQLVVIAWNLWRASDTPGGLMVAPWSLLGFTAVAGIYLAYRTAQASASGAHANAELSVSWIAQWLGIVVLGLCGWLRLQALDGIRFGWALEVYALGAVLLASSWSRRDR